MTLTEIENMITSTTDLDTIDWDSLSQYRGLSEAFMDKYFTRLNPNYLTKFQVFSESFIEKHLDELHWNLICQHQTLSENFIVKHKYDINWSIVCQYQPMTITFLNRVLTFLDWDKVSQYQVLTETFIRNNRNDVNWELIFRYQSLSTAFITSMNKYIGPKVSGVWDNWDSIAKYQTLNEAFITANISNLDMKYICRYQKLSESFITTNSGIVDWYLISIYQKLSSTFLLANTNKVAWSELNDQTILGLSESFILTNYTKLQGHLKLFTLRSFSISFLTSFMNQYNSLIEKTLILRTQVLTEAFIDTHNEIVRDNHRQQWLDWNQISVHQKLSEAFIDKHKDEVNWKDILIHQTLTESFIRNHISYLKDKYLFIVKHQNISETFLLSLLGEVPNGVRQTILNWFIIYRDISEPTITSYSDIIDWKLVSRYQVLSSTFISANSSKIVRPSKICFYRDIEPLENEEFKNWYRVYWSLNLDIDYTTIVRKARDTKHISLLRWFWEVYDRYIENSFNHPDEKCKILKFIM